MRISRDKVNKLAHTVADTLAEIDQVGFLEDRNTIRQEARKALEVLLAEEAQIDTCRAAEDRQPAQDHPGRLAGVGHSVPQVLQRRSAEAGHLSDQSPRFFRQRRSAYFELTRVPPSHLSHDTVLHSVKTVSSSPFSVFGSSRLPRTSSDTATAGRPRAWQRPQIQIRLSASALPGHYTEQIGTGKAAQITDRVD